MRSINREFYRFIFWGGVNTLSGYLIYAFLLLFLPYLLSYTVAFIVSIFTSYFLNSRFVFNQELRLSKAIKYPLVYLAQYLIGTISLYLLVQILRVNKLLAPAFVVVLTIPLTFYLSGRIVRGKTDVS
jgi:putative flippase GtrA